MTDSTAETIEGMTRERAYSVALQLNDLRLRALDHITVCNAAARCIRDEACREGIMNIRRDLEREVREMAGSIEGLEADVVGTDCPSALATFVIAKIEEQPDNAERALMKLKLHEEIVLRNFEDAATARDFPTGADTIVETAWEDARRHFAWCTRELERVRVPARDVESAP